MSRATYSTPSSAARHVKALRSVGVEVAEVRIEPDGTLRLIFSDGVQRPVADGENPCDRLLK